MRPERATVLFPSHLFLEELAMRRSTLNRQDHSILSSSENKTRVRSFSRTRKRACIARLESLEARLCPSVYYDFNVLAQSGQNGLNAIQPGASINDLGIVAFVADVAGGQSVFAHDGTSLIDVSGGLINTSLTYGPELQINNNGLVAVGDRLTGATVSTRASLFDINNPGIRTIIGRGTSPQLDPDDFDAIARFASLSNDGNLAFAGLNSTAWEIHLSNARVDRGDLLTNVATLPTSNFFRFQAADGDRIVLASRQGTTKRIQLYDTTGIDTSATIASTASGNWSELGIRPGVSDDGSIVVFFGIPTSAGAATLGVSEGPGIFASIEDGSLASRRLIRLTRGTSANPGMPELGWDDMGNPITFNYTNIDDRIGISHASLGAAGLDDDTFTVAFLATPSSASRANPVPSAGGVPLFFSNQLGLWTIRVDIDRQLGGAMNRVFHPTSARPVAQIGDVLRFGMGASSTITSLAIADPIANATSVNGAARTQRRDDHQVVFQAGTAGGGSLIVRGLHLDSDEDGLLDHWEAQTGGIDMDQDGLIDLNLYNLGARFDSRDLFLEVDWLTNRAFGVPSPSGGWDPEPAPGVAQAVVNMFAAAPALPNGIPAGIRVHFDAGDGFDALGNPRSINMGTDFTKMQGGDHIAQPGTVNHIDLVYYGIDGSLSVSNLETRSFTELKDKNFGTTDKRARELAFHYIVMADFYEMKFDTLAGALFTPSPMGIAAVGPSTLDPASPISSTDINGNPNPLAGHVVIVTSGPGAGLVRSIAANTATRITLAAPWPAGNSPDLTSQFLIVSGSSGRAEVDFYRSPDFHSVPGNDTVITLGGFGTSQVGLPGAQIDILGNLFYQWRTIVHELGHTLGLRHGGTDHNAFKGANYLSLMSYSHQTTIGSPVNSYSDGTDPTGYNDWANLRLDFQNYLVHLGNSFGQGLGSTLPPEDLPAMSVQDVIEANNNNPLDLDGPSLAILTPAPGTNFPLGSNLTVIFIASDPNGLGPLQAALDRNADGDTSDPGEVLTPTATGNPNEFSVTFTNLPAPDGSRTLFVTAQDLLGNFRTQSVSITLGLLESNVPPILNPIPNQAVDEGSLLIFNAVATDANFGQSLAYSITSGPSGASINPATGLFSFTPTEAQGPGSFTVTIRVTDNGDPPLFDEKSFQIIVREVNLPPVLNEIADQSIAELAPFTLAITATDPDLPGNAITYAFVGLVPVGMTLDPNSGALAWTPSESQGPGSYTITVRATDNGSPPLSHERSFTIHVAEVNSPPTIDRIDDKLIDELATLSFHVTAADPDLPASVLLFELIAGPPGAAIDSASGHFTFTPAEDQGPGAFLVTVRVTDSGSPALAAETSFLITVLEVNAAPALDPIADQTINELSPLVLLFTASDPDLPANTLAFSIVGTPLPGMLLDPVTGAFSWTPSEDQGPGVYSVTIRVTDNGSPPLFNEKTFQISVAEVNQPPVLAPIAPKFVALEHLLSFTVSASDPDLPLNTLLFEILSGPADATIDSTGLFQWKPAASLAPGEYPVSIRVTDDGQPNLSTLQSFLITVTTNQPPVLDPIPDHTIPEGQLFTFIAIATDPESDPLSFSLIGAIPPGAAIDPVSGLFSWTPSESQGPGVYSFSIRVAQIDQPDLAAEQLLTLTVTEVNAAPILTPIPDQSIDEGDTLLLNFTASDPDIPANTLTFSFVGLAPTGTLLNTITGAFSWTPSEAQGPGSYTITIRVSDNGLPSLSDQKSFTVTVRERNAPPAIDAGGPYSVKEGGSVILAATAADPDLPPNLLTISWDLDGDGTFESPGASVTFSAAAIDGPATRVVTVRVDDGQGGVRTAQADVHILNVAPQTVPNANQTVPEGRTVVFTAAFTDPGAAAGETFSITWLITPPVGDPFSHSGSPLSFTPTINGTYSIEFTVTDSDGASASEVALLTVEPAGPAIIGLAPISLPAGNTLSQLISISDPGLDPITSVEVDYGTGEGFQPAELDSMGRLLLEHLYPDPGTFTLRVRALDADAIASVAETLITVTTVSMDVAGPLVGTPLRHGAFYQTTRLVLPFNEPLDPLPATNPANYALFGPGRDGRINTPDDRPLAIRSIRYLPDANSVVIQPVRRLPVHARYRLIISGTPGGIADLAGNLLDGDRDGNPGGDARLLITGRSYTPAPFFANARSEHPDGAAMLVHQAEETSQRPVSPPRRPPAFRHAGRTRLLRSSSTERLIS
jgi:hypothetical protein